MILPPSAQLLNSHFGWRSAYAILGLTVLIVPLPIVAAFLKEKPQDMGLLPNWVASAEVTAPAHADAVGLTASEAWCSAPFWLIVCAFFFVGASVQGCFVHTAAMLGGAPWLAFLGAFLIGLGLGAEVDMIPHLVGRYFGLRWFARSIAWSSRPSFCPAPWARC